MLPICDRIGISTHFMPSTHGEDIFDAIRLVHEAGFRGFEIVPTLDQAQVGYPENAANVGFDLFEATSADMARLKHALSAFTWVTVHSPHLDWNLASANRHLRRMTWEYYDRCFELAVELGAAAMTYHDGHHTHGFIRRDERVWQYNVEYAQHLEPLARQRRLPVGFEAGSLRELKYVCDRVPGWGINLDIGHAYMAAGNDEGFIAYIDEFQGRIAEVHHNGVNHYWNRYMEHQPPHLNNMIDFPRTYTRLRDTGFQGPIVCELMGQDIAQTIEFSLEAKEMIAGLWEGTLTMPDRWYKARGG